MLKAAFTVFAALTLAACSSLDVGVDRDEDYDFSGARTFAWKEGVPAQNELNQKRIESGVEEALARRGIELSDSGAPDLWVATEVGGHREVRSTGESVNVSYRHHRRYGSVGMGTSSGNRIYEVKVGTLVIAILDGETEELVWRAQAEDTVGNDPQKTAETIAAAIEQSFEQFPREVAGE